MPLPRNLTLAAASGRTAAVPPPPPPWTPSDVGIPLILWYDGSQELVADGTAVEPADRSGNGLNSTQPNAALRPLVKTGIQNGKAVYRFDGANDSTQVATILNQSYYVMIAFRSRVSAGDQTVFDGATNLGGMLFQQPAGHLALYAGGQDPTVEAPANVFRIVEAYFSDPGYIRINGGDPAYGWPGSNSPDGITLGSRGNGMANGAVDIGEFLLYGGEPSAPDVASLLAYVNAKWAAF